MRSELYSFLGYAEILLADLFCSGVPLSTLDFQQDFTYQPSSTTDQVYRDALIQLDSAYSLGAGNDSALNLARVLRGRAYLARGLYDSAAAAVNQVATSFQYKLSVNMSEPFTAGGVSDREGGTGLPYRSSEDPRTATMVSCIPPGDRTTCSSLMFWPTKYGNMLSGGFTAFDTFVVADGVEARLIEAEAALHDHPNSVEWLTILNTLRASGPPVMQFGPHTFVDTLGYTGCTAVGACDANGYRTNFDYTGLVLVSSTSINIPDPDNGDPTAIINAVCRAFDPPDRTFACYNPTVNVYTDPTRVDTTVTSPMGTGGVSGLPWLTDPGASLT
jgi:hypothetical protein